MKIRILILLNTILLSSFAIKAQDEDTTFVLLPDSSNFVTASVIVASPGKAIYSQLGHAALRMECPIHKLDYCFSFEEEPGMGGILKFFLGKTNAHMMAVPTPQFLDNFKKEGRQVKQYTLGLTTHEKQELWRLLDNDYIDENMRKFNFLQNNCSSVSLHAIEDVMVDETIDFNGWPEQFIMNNGQILKYQTRAWPWLQFWCIYFLGTESDIFWKHEQQMGPELVLPTLKKATIISSNGSKRPLLIEEKELLPLVKKLKASPITPLIVFGALLLITVLITLAQLKWKLKWLPTVLDFLLMTIVTLTGLMLIYTSFVSGLFGKHWNWYLIPFNPLPFVIWLLWRKRKGFYKVYLFYTVILVLFLFASPLSQQLDFEHQLITATLAVRCLANHLIPKQELLKNKKQK